MARSALHHPASPPSGIPGAVDALVGWFARHARDLPWRRRHEPYAVWVSEVMLQQTQVRTVIPYWERWMSALPDVRSLATAPDDEVLRLWEGLGYYSRARNLQRAARQVMERHGGVFPRDPAALRELAGVGPYTAGAVASIAFDLPEPILDGNVIRVLTRWHAIPGDPARRVVNRRLWVLAREWVETASARGRGGAETPLAAGACSQLNQALMELGATVCLPAGPECGRCPVAVGCAARALGRPLEFPATAPRPPSTPRRVATVVAVRSGRLLLRRRPDGAVNAGFWEFPGLEIGASDDPRAVLARWIGEPAEAFRPVGRLRHAITRYRYTQEVFLVPLRRTPAIGGGPLRWVAREDLGNLPLTAVHRRLASRLGGGTSPGLLPPGRPVSSGAR